VQGESLNERGVGAVQFSFDPRQHGHVAAVQGVCGDFGILRLEVDPYLVESARFGFTFHQGKVPKILQGLEPRLSWFSLFPVDLYFTQLFSQYGQVYPQILKVQLTIHHGMIDFCDLPMLKLHGEMSVSLGGFGNEQ
jgi:hypothetical protein